MRFTVVALLIVATMDSSFGLDLKPGLWRVSLRKRELDGKVLYEGTDMEKLKAATSALSGEKRKKLEEAMKKEVAESSLETCITKEMLANAPDYKSRQGCTSNFDKKSGSKVAKSYTCKVGKTALTGTLYWTANSPTEFVSVEDRRFKKSRDRTEYHGTFLRDQCGSAKPLNRLLE